MGLIKSIHLPSSLSAFSLDDTEAEARAILQRAHDEAEQILAEARREADQTKLAARADGIVEGRDAGREEGRQQALEAHAHELRDVVAFLTAAAVALDAGRSELETTALQDVVRLAVAIARRVTKRQGLIEPEVLAANLAEVLKLVVRCADVRIAIHPVQRQTLEEMLPQLAVQWPDLKHVGIVEDAALAPGGCRVYTGQGYVDADLDVQLDRVVADLLPPAAEAGR